MPSRNKKRTKDVEVNSPSADTRNKKRSSSTSSSSSSSSSNKKAKRSSPISSTTEFFDEETGRLDTQLVNDQMTSIAAAQSQRFDYDENMTRDELQARYEELRDLRTSAPERLLKEAIEAHKKDKKAMQGLMDTYKRRANQLQTQINAVKQEKEAAVQDEVHQQVAEAKAIAEASMLSTIASLKAEFKKERATLVAAAEAGASTNKGESVVEQGYFKSVAKAYEQLTGLRLVMQNWEEGSQGGLNCTAINKETKKVVQFELEMDDDVEEGEEAEWDYTPGAHADLLPEYLREEISFPLSAAPKFVTRLVDALCEDTRKEKN